MKALIIDDENGIRLALGHFLRGRGFEVMAAANGAEGIALAKTCLPDLVFLDQRLPDLDGETILPLLTSPEIGASVFMMTAYVELDKAVQIMRCGADYYFPKPLDLEHIAVILDKLEETLRIKHDIVHYRNLMGENDGGGIIGTSKQIVKLNRLITLLAQNTLTPVLILGESGTGKELVAKEIHLQSGMKGPLVEINCASLSEQLFETELFGHEKGAFTDARDRKPGLFEVADGGTIFLDEVTEMPLPVQAKLLKVLDSRTFRRVGGVVDIKSSARIMAATNRDIAALVKRGKFRDDLYYRINVLPITMTPLRERGGDILLLADFFARTLGDSMGRGHVCISPEAVGYLTHYAWPGNVRELKNVVERAIILAGSGDICPEHLPVEIRQSLAGPPPAVSVPSLRPLWQVEHEYIAEVLLQTGNNNSRTAAILGISRSTLLEKLKKMKDTV